jgi:hypothetical protein
MKSLNLCLLGLHLVLSVACGPSFKAEQKVLALAVSGPQPSLPEQPQQNPKELTTDPAVISEQEKREPLLRYTGYWLNPKTQNLIFISSAKNLAKGTLETNISGMNFNQELGYLPLALAAADHPELVERDGFAEALMLRTIDRKRRVIQIVVKVESENELKIQSTAAGKSITESYVKITDEQKARQKYNKQNNQRAAAYYETVENFSEEECLKSSVGLGGTWSNGDSGSVYLVHYRRFECAKHLIEKGLLAATDPDLFLAAVEDRDVRLLRFLISKGAEVNTRDKAGKSVFEKLWEGGTSSLILDSNEHGAVVRNFNINETLQVLIDAKLDLSKAPQAFVRRCLATLEDAELVKRILTQSKLEFGSDLFSAVFSEYHLRWGTEGEKILQALLERFRLENMDNLSVDPYLQKDLIENGEPKTLKMMSDSGYKFSLLNPRGPAAKLVQMYKDALKGEVLSQKEKDDLQNRIQRIEQNLELIQKLP